MKRLNMCRFLLPLLLIGGGLNPNALAQVAPTITSFPDSQAIDLGDNVNLTVTAAGTDPLSYQWYLDGKPIPGATTATYAIASATDADLGIYSVEVSNSTGVVPAAGTGTFAAGWVHSLFVKTDGTLWVTGGNNFGQIGIPGADDQLSPVELDDGVVAVAAGGNFSLYLKDDGTLWGMGHNQFGQLGAGATEIVDAPFQIAAGVRAIAAGYYHSLFLKEDGTLWSMGDNTYGQLGVGHNGNLDMPTQVTSGVSAIAAGSWHSFFIKTDGTLWGMGQNNFGSLGDGTSENRATPVQVADGVKGVATGYIQTLILKDDRTMWTVGGNFSGQLGDGTNLNRLLPVHVANDVSLVAAAENHSFFVKRDGTLWGMGGDGYALGADLVEADMGTPVAVSSEVSSISTSQNFSLILKSDGMLWAAGFNYRGAFGDGTSEARTAPVPVNEGLARAAIISLNEAPAVVGQPVDKDVFAGGQTIFRVIATGGQLSYQWRKDGVDIPGANLAWYTLPSPQMADVGSYDVVVSNGLGTATSDAATLTVKIEAPHISIQPYDYAVEGGDNVTFTVVAYGGNLNYQWRKDGVDIPGANSASFTIDEVHLGDSGHYDVVVSNELGTVESYSRQLTVFVNRPTYGDELGSVTADSGDGIVLTATISGTNPLSFQWYKNGQPIAGATGATYSVGSASSSDIGQYSVSVSNEGGTLPVAGPGISASGGLHSLLIRADGSVRTVGNNEDGQLGIGLDVDNRLTYTPVAEDAIAVSAGFFHSFILKADGSLWGMGSSQDGQLGLFNQLIQKSPVHIMDGVLAVSAGAFHSLILKTDGTLWATGNNEEGQLGNGTLQNHLGPILVTSGVRAIAAGGAHSLFLKTDDTLWAMGNNDYGQLGDGTTTQRSSPVQIASDVSQIAAGLAFSLFVKTDGTLWATGDNQDGQLGDGSTVDRSTPVMVADRVSAVSAGGFHSMIIRTDGSLWTTGWNEWGALGDGTVESRSRFAQVAQGVSAISAGWAFSRFLKNDGTLWAMGDNFYGQLGDGNDTDQLVPVQVISGMPQAAQVTVTDPAAKLLGLSTRGFVGSGDNLMIMGFVVDGGSPKQIIVRGLGPTLAGYGVAGTIANPTLELYHDGAVIASNDDWENLPGNVDLMNSVGLQAPSSPLESVIIQTLAPGAYTAQLRGVGSGTGVGLLEIYDADPGSADPNSKLYAISTRGFMQSGDGVLIGGFVVSGEAPKQVLVQAVGPSLSAYFPGFLADPAARLERFIGGSSLVVAENDDWETGNDRNMMMGARMRSGATPLTDGAKDASMLLWIEPGIYTAVSYGSDGGTGVALMNIYEVPPE